MRAAVDLKMDASPDRVWGLVSDITKMGEYSPEVVEAEWIDGSTGPVVGARYRGHVRRNENWPFLYWTTCKITECVPGQVFEFAVIMGDRPVNTWRYEFRGTDDGGTEVTESFDLGDNLFTKIWHPLGGFLRERRNQRDMLRTLERIKAVAERPRRQPGT
ncbi:MAG TPA: SRPBCC family protein [Acidimicrobiales bacterium]|nr:SRPBCC family protein [Acidimicrobiales bacterium]